MYNPLVGHIDIVHTDHKLRKVIFDLKQIPKLPFLFFSLHYISLQIQRISSKICSTFAEKRA